MGRHQNSLLGRNPITESRSSSRFDVFEQARAAGAPRKAEANALPRMSVVRTPCVRLETDGAIPTKTCWISRVAYPRNRLPSLLCFETLPLREGIGATERWRRKNLNLPFRPAQLLQTSACTGTAMMPAGRSAGTMCPAEMLRPTLLPAVPCRLRVKEHLPYDAPQPSGLKIRSDEGGC